MTRGSHWFLVIFPLFWLAVVIVWFKFCDVQPVEQWFVQFQKRKSPERSCKTTDTWNCSWNMKFPKSRKLVLFETSSSNLTVNGTSYRLLSIVWVLSEFLSIILNIFLNFFWHEFKWKTLFETSMLHLLGYFIYIEHWFSVLRVI